MQRRAVITGIGVVAPNALGKDEFCQAIREGRSGIGPITLFDVSEFASRIGGQVKEFDTTPFLSKKEARRMDRFTLFGVIASDLAVKDSGLDMEQENGDRIGVIIGSGIGGIGTFETQHDVLKTRGPSRVSPFMVPMMIGDMAAGQVSIRFNARGPNLDITTACASGTHSIGEAFHKIRHGQADVFIAGGAEACISPLGLAGFSSMKALSFRNDDPLHASRPFDRERDGFVIAEGAGILIVEEYERAKRRGAHIYAEVVGYGATADAHHMTAPAPGGEGAARSMAMALADAGIAPDEVDYINAHGTSTPLNDKLETMAIKTVLGAAANKVKISSTKSMTGHLLGAAGPVESAGCMLMMEQGFIHPTINYEHPDPECDLDYVPNTAIEHPVKVVLKNSFGFGGHNASLVFKKI